MRCLIPQLALDFSFRRQRERRQRVAGCFGLCLLFSSTSSPPSCHLPRLDHDRYIHIEGVLHSLPPPPSHSLTRRYQRAGGETLTSSPRPRRRLRELGQAKQYEGVKDVWGNNDVWRLLGTLHPGSDSAMFSRRERVDHRWVYWHRSRVLCAKHRTGEHHHLPGRCLFHAHSSVGHGCHHDPSHPE